MRCYTCGEIGHISTKCLKQKNSNVTSPNIQFQSSFGIPANGNIKPVPNFKPVINALTVEEIGTEPGSIAEKVPNPISVVSLDRTPPLSIMSHRCVIFLVNGLPYNTLVDTGATLSCIELKIVEELKLKIDENVKGNLGLAIGQIKRIGQTEEIAVTAVFPPIL